MPGRRLWYCSVGSQRSSSCRKESRHFNVPETRVATGMEEGKKVPHTVEAGQPLHGLLNCSSNSKYPDWLAPPKSPVYWPAPRGRDPAGPRAVSDRSGHGVLFRRARLRAVGPRAGCPNQHAAGARKPPPRSLFNRMDLEDLGLVVDWDHHLPPPAAKAVVESLPRTVISGSQAELKCPVCLLEFEEQETVIEMPCHHLFHSNCILPWLSKTNSCPLCRHELPTDDDTYEEHRRDKARKQQQQHRLENLHGAMYT
ncbi:E3 ubiquitin-protein ligase RNF181 isoform X2 [Marmota flaviventris]